MANTKSKRGRGTKDIVEAQDTGSSTDAQSKSSDGVLANTSKPRSTTGVSRQDKGEERITGEFDNESNQRRRWTAEESKSATQSRMGKHLSDGLSTPLAELDLGIARVGADIPDRAKKLKAIGNAIVPDIPEVIMRIMIDDEES